MKRFHLHLEDTQIAQLEAITKATGRSAGRWIRQAIDDLVVKMVELGVIDASAPLRDQRRESWEREIKEELLARRELKEKLGPGGADQHRLCQCRAYDEQYLKARASDI